MERYTSDGVAQGIAMRLFDRLLTGLRRYNVLKELDCRGSQRNIFNGNISEVGHESECAASHSAKQFFVLEADFCPLAEFVMSLCKGICGGPSGDRQGQDRRHFYRVRSVQGVFESAFWKQPENTGVRAFEKFVKLNEIRISRR